MASDRALGRNNAGSDTLAKDFARIGLIFWPAIIALSPRHGPVLETSLTKLVEMRNAIAHDNEAQILKLESTAT